MRLISYNIHKGIGGRDRRYRLGRILEVLLLEKPDLLCLQEVARGNPRSYRDDQTRILAEIAGGRFFQPVVHWQEGGYGNLILSRWPMRDAHALSLRFDGKKPRGAQLAVVETPEGDLLLANCHLGLGERERQWQVRHLLEHRRFLEQAHLPTLIAGDMNDWRDTLGPGPLLKQGFRPVAAPPWRFRSFPAWLAVGSLDKAFVRGEFRVRKARIVRSRLTRAASDHLPLVVDFDLRPAESASGSGG